MTYRAALGLIDLAKQGDLLDDYRVRRLIWAVARTDNPRLERNVERYIGGRVLERVFARVLTGRSRIVNSPIESIQGGELYLAELLGLPVQIPFYRQSEWPTHGFKL